MRRVSCSLALTLLAFVPAIACGQSRLESFKLSEDKFFANYRSVLIDYLRTQHVHTRTRACILGEKDSGGDYFAWVIWPAGRQIILWEDGVTSLDRSRRLLNLNKDVVATNDDINGSDYLVTRQWVKEQEEKCDKEGISLEIEPAELK